MTLLGKQAGPKLNLQFFRQLGVVFLLLPALPFPLPVLGQGIPQIRKPPVTVRDAISMTRLGLPDYELSGRLDRLDTLFSPDGRRFVILLKKGNLNHNTVDYSVYLYRTEDALNSPRPDLLFTLSSSSNREAVRDLRWLADSQSLAFLGENPGELPQVYEFSLRTRLLGKLTEHPTPVVSFDISADGKTVLFEADPAPQTCLGSAGNSKSAIAITTQAVSALLGCDGEFHATKSAGEQLFLSTAAGEINIPVEGDILYAAPSIPAVSLSPDGRYALVAGCPLDFPAFWSEYEDRLLQQAIRSDHRRKGQAFPVARYLLLSTQDRKLRPLFDTPAASPPQKVVWTPDGSAVFLSGVRLPLDKSLDASAKEARKKQTYIIQVKFPEGEVRKITNRNLRVEEWDPVARRLVLSLPPEAESESPARVAFAFEGSVWREVPLIAGPRTEDQRIGITVKEGPNLPPRIYAEDAGSRKKALLLDLNPQFSKLAFARVEVITWKATDGHRMQGGLFLPPDYRPGKRYPLVIQTHGFLPDKFYIDGPWSSAFAAQPLAGKDIAVVQVGYSLAPDEARYVNTPLEAPREMAAYEGLIDSLDRRGLIDRDRVGIIGFSRTVYKVAYTLTHSRYRFAAATLADGIDGSYFEYLLFQVENDPLLNGGLPFGRTLLLWFKNSPEFSMNKVHTPIRLEAYGPVSALGKWNWFSGLSVLGKPVDFIYLPRGAHLLSKPSERMASQQGNVDWFCFWLKGEEDRDPQKREQYERWEEMRRMLEGNQQQDVSRPGTVARLPKSLLERDEPVRDKRSSGGEAP